jgi:hypothetical protein
MESDAPPTALRTKNEPAFCSIQTRTLTTPHTGLPDGALLFGDLSDALAKGRRIGARLPAAEVD